MAQPDKIEWSNVQVKLGELKPWSDNPRYTTKEQAKRLVDSWTELGQFQTIAIGPEQEVYDGHQRLSALLTLHGKTFVVAARAASRPLTDAERQRLVITAHVGAVGSWDWDKLSAWDAPAIEGWGMDADTLKLWNNDAMNLREFLGAELQQQKTLEQLQSEYGELSEEELWPWIRLQVSPDAAQRFKILLDSLPGIDELARFTLLLDRAEQDGA